MNPGTARTILTKPTTNSTQGQSSNYGNALFNHGQGQSGHRVEEEEQRSFERPPPKGGSELYNPKGGPKRSGSSQAKDRKRGDGASCLPALVDGVAGMYIQEPHKAMNGDPAGLSSQQAPTSASVPSPDGTMSTSPAS